MVKILVLYGSSGVGKSTIMEILNKSSIIKFQLVTKYTTRPIRENDLNHNTIGGTDLIKFSAKVNFSYTCYDELYGFDLAEIDFIISNRINVVLDIGDIEAIKKLKSIYSEKLNVIWVERDLSKKKIIEILKKRATNEKEIEKRLQIMDEIKEHYNKNRNLFDYSIMNNGSFILLNSQINSILNILKNEQ